jgi:hypothetical protein
VSKFDDAVFKQVLLKQAERMLAGSLERHQPEEPFFHYTNGQGLLGILRNGSIYGTEYTAVMGDDGELKCGEAAIHAELEVIAQEYPIATARGGLCRAVLDFRKGHRTIDLPYEIYLTSFSTIATLAGQWCQYADAGQGFAIGFKTLPLPVAVQGRPTLSEGLQQDFRPCIYCEHDFRAVARQELYAVADRLETLLKVHRRNLTEQQVRTLKRAGRVIATALLGVWGPFLKGQRYAAEQEWRFFNMGTTQESDRIRFRTQDGREATRVLISLRKPDLMNVMDLHSVVVGPRAPADAYDLARSTLDRLGYSHVPVVRSDVPLR